MECTKCNLQYVGKAEIEFSLRINSYRIDVLRRDVIPADQHFEPKDHDLNTHTKFTTIELLKNINFWIKKLVLQIVYKYWK